MSAYTFPLRSLPEKIAIFSRLQTKVYSRCRTFKPPFLTPHFSPGVYTFTPEQTAGLTQWVANGHGFVGVHSAADSFKSNPEYTAMLGAVFRKHPPVRRFIVSLVDPVSGEESIENHMTHPITAAMEGYTKPKWKKWPIFEYEVEDEQYLMEMVSSVDVLANTLFRGRACPIAWTRSWGEGRVFYLALGHDMKACRFPFFKSMFLQGSRWAGEMI